MIEMYQCCCCDNYTSTRANIYICNCNRAFCIDCLKADFDPDNEDYGLCQFCTGNDVTDSQLLDYALEKLQTTKELLANDYFSNYKGKMNGG